MLRRCARRAARSQHTTPDVPQCRAPYDGPKGISVGYLLSRPQVVRHAPHPVELEFAAVLDREHRRYGRHQAAESASHYFAAKGLSIDTWGRPDPQQAQDNFFNMPLYEDALLATVGRYRPAPRLAAADFTDPTADAAGAKVPRRQTLNRALADLLFLIVRDAATGRWAVPSAPRAAEESLRSTAERAISEHHGGALQAYLWSNAPQAVFRPADPACHDPGAAEPLLFLFAASYLSGRPDFGRVTPPCVDHAWVTRGELPEYNFGVDNRLLKLLLDIAPDATFAAPATAEPPPSFPPGLRTQDSAPLGG